MGQRGQVGSRGHWKPEAAHAKRGGAACQTGAPFLERAGLASVTEPCRALHGSVWSTQVAFVVGRSQSARGQVPTLRTRASWVHTPTAAMSSAEPGQGRGSHVSQTPSVTPRWPWLQIPGASGQGALPPSAPHCWVSHFLSCPDPLHPRGQLSGRGEESLLSSPAPPPPLPAHPPGGAPGPPPGRLCKYGTEVPLHGTFPF